MVEVRIETDHAVFEVEGWDKLWSLRSQLQIPLSHILGAYIDPDLSISGLGGLKIAGTGFPNLIRAGTFFQHGQFVFWDVHHAERAIVIELEHENYKRLIIEVEHPEEEVKKINKSVGYKPLTY